MPLIVLGLLYILGAVFYALRVPERWFPGKFDLWVSFLSLTTYQLQKKMFIKT